MNEEDTWNEVEVDMNDFQDAEPPQYLWTHGLGPCIGIGVIDLDAHHGYLMHVAGPSMTALVDPFFQTLRSCSQNVKIVVAGGDTSGDKSGDTVVAEDRAYVIQKLRDIFPNVPHEYFWSPPDGSCWVKVDPGAGKITYDIH